MPLYHPALRLFSRQAEIRDTYLRLYDTVSSKFIATLQFCVHSEEKLISSFICVNVHPSCLMLRGAINLQSQTASILLVELEGRTVVAVHWCTK